MCNMTMRIKIYCWGKYEKKTHCTTRYCINITLKYVFEEKKSRINYIFQMNQ